MPNIVTLLDDTIARIQAEENLKHARNIEHAHKIVELAGRLHHHRSRFRRKDLFLAFEVNSAHPAVYIVRRDRTRWCGRGGAARLPPIPISWH